MGAAAAAADVDSNMSDELTTYRSQNGDMRLRNRHSGGGSLADNTSSVNGGDIVTTTHTISEMRVHERSQRGRQSEKHVVVKMAVRHKSHRHGGGDGSDDGGGGAERDMNGTNRNDGQYNNHNGSRAITVEEIDGDDGEEDKTTRGRDASDHSDTMNNSGSMANNSNGNLQLTDVTDATIQETMLQLVTETEHMKQYFHGQEQAFRRESEYIEQLKQEHKALKTMAKEYKCRAREQKRVQRILREVKKKDRQSHSRGNKRKVKKQCQRLQQYQSELALRLELVQSKNNVYEMHVEKQLAELRREYSDSYLFPNPFQ